MVLIGVPYIEARAGILLHLIRTVGFRNRRSFFLTLLFCMNPVGLGLAGYLGFSGTIASFVPIKSGYNGAMPNLLWFPFAFVVEIVLASVVLLLQKRRIDHLFSGELVREARFWIVVPSATMIIPILFMGEGNLFGFVGIPIWIICAVFQVIVEIICIAKNPERRSA
jgi:hypothetical protein